MICQVHHLEQKPKNNSLYFISIYFAIWIKHIAESSLADYPLDLWPPLQHSYSKGDRITTRVMGGAHISLVLWNSNKFILLSEEEDKNGGWVGNQQSAMVVIFFSFPTQFIKKFREAYFRIESFIIWYPPAVKCQLQVRNCTGVHQRWTFKTQCCKQG